MTIRERLETATDQVTLESIIAQSEVLAEQFRLPFSQKNWRGLSGNWAGAGVGSSIDFQDHRPYVPGDDPRYINWQAYARSGNYSMKLYREEVSPQVDLVLDLTDSMFNEPEKAVRALELFYFACQSAWRHASLLNVILVNGDAIEQPDVQSIRAGAWKVPASSTVGSKFINWSRIPWRTQSMRLVISDFLFEEDPAAIIAAMSRQAGALVMWSVYTQAEMAPEWIGNTELLDCESDKRVRRYFVQEDMDLYRKRYTEHCTMWADTAARHAARFSRIHASGRIDESLHGISGLGGGVELCK